MLTDYKGVDIVVRGGEWNDLNNRFLYTVIDSDEHFDFCVENASKVLFALKKGHGTPEKEGEKNARNAEHHGR